MPNATPANSLAAPPAPGNPDDDDVPVLFVDDIDKIPRQIPAPLRLSPRYSPLSVIGSGRSRRELHSDDSSASDSSSSIDSGSVMTPRSVFSALACESEPDAKRAAHFVYAHAFEDEANLSAPALQEHVDRLIRMVTDVNVSVLRATLRRITIASFGEMWKSVNTARSLVNCSRITNLDNSLIQRTDLWTAVEQASHPHAHVRTIYDYGAPARKLAMFAGVLFALDIFCVRELQGLIDRLRVHKTIIALQALHDVVRYAGDKICKSKGRDYMIRLQAEQASRAMLPPFAGDLNAHELLSVSRFDVNFMHDEADKVTVRICVSSSPSTSKCKQESVKGQQDLRLSLEHKRFMSRRGVSVVPLPETAS